MDDRKQYYEFLEELRKSGVTNMWGAAPFLQAEFDISAAEARDILLDWIKNYSELAKEYGWGNEVEVKTDEVDFEDSRAKELFDGDVDRQDAEDILQAFDDEPDLIKDAEHIWLVDEAPLVVKYKDGKVKFFDSTDGHIEVYDDLIDWCNTYGYEYEDVAERVFAKTGLDKPSATIEKEKDEEEIFDGDSEVIIDDEEEVDDQTQMELDYLEQQERKHSINKDESLNEAPEHEYRDEAMISLGQVGVAHDVTGEYIIFKDTRDGETNKDTLKGLTKTDVKYIIQACTELLQKESK